MFFNNIFTAEGDIFDNCSTSRAPLKRVIMEEISSIVLKLEAHTILNIPEQTIFKVVDILIVEKLVQGWIEVINF